MNAIHAATDRAVGLNFNKTKPDTTIPMPITRIPPIPVIKFASWAGKWNCDSKYFGKNVYRPAIGSKCNTEDAVRNMRISFFKCRLIVFGKSETKFYYFSVKLLDKRIWFNWFTPFNWGIDSSSWGSTFAFCAVLCASIAPTWCGAGILLPRSCFGNASIANDVMIIIDEIMTKPGNRS